MTVLADRYIDGKIRDFELNIEDAARLADCFNSFDDSDSWPGGFTHGTPFTAKRILERKQKSEDIRTIVAYDGDKIVGHCNLTHSELDRDGAYVGILGVRPDYQGRGYGKAMLIAATETAAKIGKRRVELNTWAGNLKAMPLYKRVGFNWVPNTRVLMESYIPSIIGAPLFKEFFRRHYWYDSLKREITQMPDDITRDGIGVYEYHFEGDNGDSLDVTIDRYAKGICGFRLTLDGETIRVKIVPESQIGFIGFESVPVKMELVNETKRDLRVSIGLDQTEYLRDHIEGPTQLTAKPGETITLRGKYSISTNAMPYSITEPYERVKTWALWHMQVNDDGVDLLSGVVPYDAITLSVGPENLCVTPGQRASLTVTLTNNTPREIRGIIVTGSTPERTHEPKKRDFQIESGRSIHYTMTVETHPTDENTVVPIDTAVYVKDEKTVCIKRTKIPVAVLGDGGAIAYERLDGRAVLESGLVRIEFEKGPIPTIKYIEYKLAEKTTNGWMLSPLIGYPFPDEGGEWISKKYTPKYVNRGDVAEIVFTADSIDRPGLRATFTYRLTATKNEFEFFVKLQNIGTSIFTNLGLRVECWTNDSFNTLYIPLKDNFYRLSSPIWSHDDQVPDEPDAFAESWYACHDSDTGNLAGVIWDTTDLVTIRPTSKQAPRTIEYKIPDLGPGESLDKRVIRLVMGRGVWQDIRKRWALLNREQIDLDEEIVFHSDLEVAIVPPDNQSIAGRTGSPVIIDLAKENQMEVRVEIVNRDPISGSVKISAPKGVLLDGKNEIEFEIEKLNIDEPFVRTISMTASDGHWLHTGGEITLQFPSRVERVPLRVIVYDSRADAVRTVEKHGEATLHTLTCGTYRISASPEHAGSLVAYGPKDSPSLFYDTFPEVKPFIWRNKQYSGLNPAVMVRNVWDWETGIQMEQWTVEDLEDEKYVGYRITSTLQHTASAKDLRVSYDYRLLRGTPLLHIEVKVENIGDSWKRFEAGAFGVPTIGMSEKDTIHLVRAGRLISYEPTPISIRLKPDASEDWVAVERSTGEVLGIVASSKFRSSIQVIHIGEAGHILGFADDFNLGPGHSANRDWWLIHAESLAEIIELKDISAE